MLARLKGHLGVAGVLVVRHGQIDHIDPLQQLKIIGRVLRDMVLLTQLGGRGRTALGAAKGLYRERRVLPRQPRQKFPHDHARAQNS